MPDSTTPIPLGVNIPSEAFLKAISGMSAACVGGQAARLNWAREKLATLPAEVTGPDGSVRLYEVDRDSSAPAGWQEIFRIISPSPNDPRADSADRQAKLKQVKKILNYLKAHNDKLYLALLKAHSEEYILKIIEACLFASEINRPVKILTQENTDGLPNKLILKDDDDEDADVKVTAATFEFIIRNLLATLQNRHNSDYRYNLHLSITPPGHHGYHTEGNGFCIFNNTAIMMAYDENAAAEQRQELTKIIVGLDVNQDDGLVDTWWHDDASKHTVHIDIFDSRVYPHNKQTVIEHELFKNLVQSFDTERRNQIKATISDHPGKWIQYSHGTNQYTAVNLKKMQRTGTADIHPALEFTINKIKAEIAKAKNDGRKVALYIPMGWDSHVNEEAECSSFRGKSQHRDNYMKSRRRCRFNDHDMRYFYNEIKGLLNDSEYEDYIQSIYFTLEGGYTKKVNDQQLEMFMRAFAGIRPESWQTPEPVTSSAASTPTTQGSSSTSASTSFSLPDPPGTAGRSRRVAKRISNTQAPPSTVAPSQATAATRTNRKRPKPDTPLAEQDNLKRLALDPQIVDDAYLLMSCRDFDLRAHYVNMQYN